MISFANLRLVSCILISQSPNEMENDVSETRRHRDWNQKLTEQAILLTWCTSNLILRQDYNVKETSGASNPRHFTKPFLYAVISTSQVDVKWRFWNS